MKKIEGPRPILAIVTMLTILALLPLPSAAKAVKQDVAARQLEKALSLAPLIPAEKAFQKALTAYKAGDITTAAKWSHMAALQGHAEGQHALGTMFATGQGVDQDFHKAFKWWQLAADQGDARSFYNLGLLFAYGRGVKQNLVEAYKWLHLAAEWGMPKAEDMRTRIAKGMNLGDVAVSQQLAREWVAQYAAK